VYFNCIFYLVVSAAFCRMGLSVQMTGGQLALSPVGNAAVASALLSSPSPAPAAAPVAAVAAPAAAVPAPQPQSTFQVCLRHWRQSCFPCLASFS
jgi:hypothetical protein